MNILTMIRTNDETNFWNSQNIYILIVYCVHELFVLYKTIDSSLWISLSCLYNQSRKLFVVHMNYCKFPIYWFIFIQLWTFLHCVCVHVRQMAKTNWHFFKIQDRKGTPKIIQLIRQAQGLAPNPEEESALKKLTPHVPGIVTFANHSRALPWTTSYTTVLMFADISGNFDKVVNFFIKQSRWYRGF